MSLKAAIWIPMLTLFAAAAAALFLAGAAAPQPDKEEYQVVMTKPLRVPGRRVNEMFRTDDLMTEAFNQLEEEGLVPIFFEVFEAGTSGDFTESRAV